MNRLNLLLSHEFKKAQLLSRIPVMYNGGQQLVILIQSYPHASHCHAESQHGISVLYRGKGFPSTTGTPFRTSLQVVLHPKRRQHQRPVLSPTFPHLHHSSSTHCKHIFPPHRDNSLYLHHNCRSSSLCQALAALTSRSPPWYCRCRCSSHPSCRPTA